MSGNHVNANNQSLSLLKNSHKLAQTSDADKLTTFENQAPADQQLQKALIAQNKPEAALEVAERSRSRAFVNLLTRQGLATNASMASVPPSITKIKQIAKQQNATLVEYSIITEKIDVNGQQQPRESELYLWVINPTGEVSFRNIDLKAMQQKENTSLSNLIAKNHQLLGVTSNGLKGINKVKGVVESGSLTSSKEQLQKLYQLLIEPIADFLPTQPNEHVIFIPQGQLFLVPFAALQDAKGKYLIEKHTISTAPSIQALDLLYQRQQRVIGVVKDVLIVGNPTMPSVPPQPGKPSQKLQQLPGAEQEAKAIAQLFNTQALTGDAATETAVVQRMSQAKIIHLATQGLNKFQGKDIPGALALTSSNQDDGWLTSEEILNLNLKADLVVLSSGDTALGRITGDGVIGLSRSFFAAGVPSVIGSLWCVSDMPTVLLMIEFYQKLRENPDKAAALRYAMLETMKKYPNPRDWAAFTLIGLS
ncbi:CHAT domain-containing protein [Scytonema sp. PRP1]|uniref:CHAT domain-containing protein n=1 Tax=Scytonema sp. PRP1 TaxID=3120513 RepID=UPI00300C0B05